MSKVKGSKDATKSSSSLSKAKDAAVTKPAQVVKGKGKEIGKYVAAKVEETKKKVVHESSDSDSEESASSASSGEEDSEEESEVETKKPVANGKVNGKANGVKHAAAESSDESDASDEEEDGPASGVTVQPATVNRANVKAKDSESESDEESDSDEEIAVEKNSSPVKAAGLNKKLSKVNDESEASDESEEDSDESNEEVNDESESSEESDEEEEKVKVAPQPVKRKAEEAVVPAPKKAKVEAPAEAQGTNLFVGNLSWNVDEAWLTQEFEQFGELTGVRLITDRDSGRSKGFGYVEFANAADAAKAHTEMKGTELDGRALNVDFANSRSSGGDRQQRTQSRAKSFGDVTSPPSDTLFCGNLSFDVGQDAVSQAFNDFGTVLGIRLPTDRETGQPKGFGYVTFSSVDEAKAALEGMQGAEIGGRSVRLDYSQPRPQNNDSPRGGRGGFGGRGGRGGGRGGRGGFNDRGGRGGGRGSSTNRGGFGDFSGRKTTF